MTMVSNNELHVPEPQVSCLPPPRAMVVRFALSGIGLPAVETTLPLADQFRRAVMGLYRRRQESRVRENGVGSSGVLPSSPLLSGKDADGNPLIGHRHAFYLPTDEDRDGRIEHLTAFCEAGFGERELDALRHLRRLQLAGAEKPLQPVLIGCGTLSEVWVPLAGESATWVSATPFVASRHLKRRGRRRERLELLKPGSLLEFVIEVLYEEIDRLRAQRPEVPRPTDISPLLSDDGMYCIPAGKVPARRFARYRPRHGESDTRRPFGAFRVAFPEPVRGPLCLGRSSHFG
ncbi:MAG: type I-U CRISPR-associated protein Cas5/Cas6, partial [Planctomycetes bacterium]|nr:type I-U CRISPR-associated protein Cas5/Cas6 [Planctomycetota bacterium]